MMRSINLKWDLFNALFFLWVGQESMCSLTFGARVNAVEMKK